MEMLVVSHHDGSCSLRGVSVRDTLQPDTITHSHVLPDTQVHVETENRFVVKFVLSFVLLFSEFSTIISRCEFGVIFRQHDPNECLCARCVRNTQRAHRMPKSWFPKTNTSMFGKTNIFLFGKTKLLKKHKKHQHMCMCRSEKTTSQE